MLVLLSPPLCLAYVVTQGYARDPLGADLDVLAAFLATTVLGGAAYGALFTFLSVLLRRPLPAGPSPAGANGAAGFGSSVNRRKQESDRPIARSLPRPAAKATAFRVASYHASLRYPVARTSFMGSGAVGHPSPPPGSGRWMRPPPRPWAIRTTRSTPSYSSRRIPFRRYSFARPAFVASPTTSRPAMDRRAAARDRRKRAWASIPSTSSSRNSSGRHERATRPAVAS